MIKLEEILRKVVWVFDTRFCLFWLYNSLRITHFNDFRCFLHLIDSFNMVLSPNPSLFFIHNCPPIMPGMVIFMSLVDTLLVVGDVFAFAIEAP
jgi:hypothetical protein